VDKTPLYIEKLRGYNDSDVATT